MFQGLATSSDHTFGRRDWLRLLSIGVMLLAFGAFFLQSVAHASPHVQSAHHDAVVAAMAQHGDASHATGDASGATAKHGAFDKAGQDLLDCYQACQLAAILPQMPPPPRAAGNAHPIRRMPDLVGRIPAAILKPPRLIAVA